MDVDSISVIQKMVKIEMGLPCQSQSLRHRIHDSHTNISIYFIVVHISKKKKKTRFEPKSSYIYPEQEKVT
jgi:hypothetical protein